jgi:hypothetical protein
MAQNREGSGSLGKTWRRRKNNIKTDLEEISWTDVDWIFLT